MVFQIIKIFKIIIFSCIFILSLYYIQNASFKTNITEAILPHEYVKNSNLINILNKTTNTINVIFEAKSEEELQDNKDDFIKNLDKNAFEVVSFDSESLYEYYSKNPTGFLSDEARKDLKEKNYNKIYEKAILNLYSPLGFQVMPFDKDPYYLFYDFILSNLSDIKNKTEINGKIYSYINIKTKDDYNFSSSKVNENIKHLIKTNKNENIYFSGSLIHSYYSTKNTSIYVNIVCITSILLVIFLTYFYFKKLYFLLPVALSLIFGFSTGFGICSILFKNFHIITLLFATALIGIGFDYSFHYLFNGKSDKKFIKNLSFSYLTTALSFLILYFSKIELLKQISVFMIFGLLGVYLFVVFIFPYFNFNCQTNDFEIKINNKYKKLIAGLFIFLSLFGLTKIKFNDDLTSLYIPNKSLKQSETIYNTIVNKDNQNINFLIIKDENIEKNLQKEEKLTQLLKNKNIKFISLSKFIPSKKMQGENLKLTEELYENNLNNFDEFLTKEQISEIKKEIKNRKALDFDFDNPISRYFMPDKDKTMVIAYSNNISEFQSYCDEIVNIRGDISSYLKKYRIKLLKLLPVTYLVLYFVLILLFGISKGNYMCLPVFLSTIIALLLSLAFGMEINLFSLISLFLIIGFTVDYSIFRINGDKKSNCSIFVCAITTSFSFLALSFTSFKLISSMSLVVFFGIFCSYIIGKILFDKISS